MINAINNLKKDYNDASFIITGHSLGSAIATIAALEV